MKQRFRPLCLAAMVLLLGGLLPGSRALGQEGSPTPAASPAAAAAVPSRSPGVVIDGKGNAVVHQSDTEGTAKGITRSNVTASINLPTGLSVLTARLALPDAKDGKGSAYVDSNGKKIFAVASFSSAVDPKDKVPTADVNLSVKQDGSTSVMAGKLDLGFNDPEKKAPFNTMGLDFNGTMTGYKASQSLLHFVMTGPTVLNSVTPVITSADIKIAEATGTTTITATVSLPPSSPGASSFAQLEASPTALETQIQSTMQAAGFNVQSVKFANVHTKPDAGATLTIVVKDFHKSLETLVQSKAAGFTSMGVNASDLQKSLDELLQIQLDSLDLQMSSAADKLDVTLNSNVTNFDKFVLGYLDLYTAILPTISKMHGQKSTPLGDLLMQANVINLQHARVLWDQASANSADKWTWKVGLNGTVSPTGDIKVTGSLDSNGDIKSLVTAAKASNYPMMDTQYVLLHGKCDGKQANADLYLDASGAWFDGLKAPYAEAAKKTPGFEQVAGILAALEFSDSKMSFDLASGGINGTGYAQFSDLTPVVKAALAKNAPSFTGDFVALNFVSDNPTGTTTNNSVDMFLTGVPKTEAEIKTDLANLGSLGTLPVTTSADGKDTVAPTLSKPSVSMPQELNSVADNARKELGIAALPVPGVPGGKTVAGSNTNMTLLIAGIAIILIVGLAAASKGKKS